MLLGRSYSDNPPKPVGYCLFESMSEHVCDMLWNRHWWYLASQRSRTEQAPEEQGGGEEEEQQQTFT